MLAHRQAFAWTDEWYDLTYEKIVEYERLTYEKTNIKVLLANNHDHNNNNDNNNSNSSSEGNKMLS